LLKKGTKLIFCSSPFYNTNLEETNTIKYVKYYAKRHNIPYLDYSNYQIISRQNEYYYGQLHLNQKGAYEFSRIIAGRLKSEMIKNVCFQVDTLK